MVPILAKIANEKETEWSNLLKQAEFVANNMVSSATGDTPARLLFGVDQRFGQKFDAEEWMDFVNEGDISREERRTVAKNNIDRAQDYNKEYYDRKVVKEKKFGEGDWVLLKGRKVEGGKSKLYGKFKGPYRIEKVLTKDRYLVSDIEGLQIGKLPYTGIVDTGRMKLYEANKCNEATDDERNRETSGGE